MTSQIQTSGELFEAVQENHIFIDSKTFVDSTPKRSPHEIITDFIFQKEQPNFDLANFITQNFELPTLVAKDLKLDPKRNMEEHINYLWDILCREPDSKDPKSTLIPLPNPYIVPGGRFSEIYYWDSYFTAEGLAASGRYDLVQNMADNFAYLIEQYGHIPNGNRNYYLSRSQPPFFFMLVQIIYRKYGISAIKKYLSALESEYNFWMHTDRLIELDDDSRLNRYWDDSDTPRPESYREDLELAKQHQDKHTFYRNIRAAAESGWDFSSRWFADSKNLASIITTEIIPIDLNAILYGLETHLATWFSELGDAIKSSHYYKNAQKRKSAINKYLWDEHNGFYFDYRFTTKAPCKIWSLASAYPLFFNISDSTQANRVAKHLENKFLQVGGVVTTLNQTTEQWDAPNGWAPLQWITVIGLKNYNFHTLSMSIIHNFTMNAQTIFSRTGKMMEKYNVCDLSVNAHGGEYPLQDGFGWTNGVIMAFLLLKQQIIINDETNYVLK